MQNDLVSVIIPTKDREQAVIRALDSVLQQTYKNLEVIVVDDGSIVPFRLQTDDPRVRVLRNNASKGNAGARNAGMRAAKGAYFCLLDDDDFYYPHKIALQYAYLKQLPGVDLVFSDVVLLNEATGRCMSPYAHNYSFDVRSNFLQMNRIHTNGTLFKRSVFDGVQFNEDLTKFNDTYFYLAVSLIFKIDYLPSVVAVWTHSKDRRDSRVSSARAKRAREQNYHSFKLLCNAFGEYISKHDEMHQGYMEKLALLAMEVGRHKDAWKYVNEVDDNQPWLTFMKLAVAAQVPFLRRVRYWWIWRKHYVRNPDYVQAGGPKPSSRR